MNKSMLRLFNCIQVDEKVKIAQDVRILGRTVSNGFVLDEFINPTDEILKDIEDVVGISGEKANASFHKSWKVVKNSSNEELLLQQIVHYITTYGFERLGIYSEDTVYIPHEKLEVPEISENLRLTVIRGLTSQEILDKIVSLGSSGIALSDDTLSDIMVIVESNKYDKNFVGYVSNRELKSRLMDYYHIVPDEPEEFLRYIVSKLTDTSLLIKSRSLIELIKESNGKFLDELMINAPNNLASIFFRYKPLFLAMKSISRDKSFYNRLRKDADILHKPVNPDVLNRVTSDIKSHSLNLNRLSERLKNVTVFRKIRLLNALMFRLHGGDSIVYRVRNGKGWAESFDWDVSKHKDGVVSAMRVVADSIKSGMDVDGKIFYLPNGVEYALPTSEKQFVGNIPFGSYIEVPDNLLVSVHWKNLSNYRVDLDFSAISLQGKIGWDSAYRTTSRSVMFSGDVTDAPSPNGATETFYFGDAKSAYIMNLNYYNFSGDHPVNAKLFVSSRSVSSMERNYIVDSNFIVSQASIKIDKKENSLGLVYDNKFYFYEMSSSDKISSRLNDVSKHSIQYLIDSLLNRPRVSALLTSAGAIIVRERPDDGEYVDLSPESIDKTTIIDLF